MKGDEKLRDRQSRISIVIPLYNKKKTISVSLDSILAQKYENYEVIIVDDGSTDDSVRVVEEYLSEKIFLFKKENGGQSSARNLGVRMAKGEWVVFLDADDYFEPNAFNVFNRLIVSHPECEFFCCNYYEESGDSKRIHSSKHINRYLWNNFFAWSAGYFMPRAGVALFRRDLLLRFPQDEMLMRYEDAGCLFDIMRDVRVYMYSDPVMTYCRHNSNASHPCKDISQDFIGHLSLKGKGMWEQYALAELYKEGVFLYPKQIHKLYRKQDIRTFKVKLASCMIKVLKAISLL